jgi:hypothetical protein
MEKLVPDVWDQIVALTRAQMSLDEPLDEQPSAGDNVVSATVFDPHHPHIGPNADLIDPTGWVTSKRY